MISLEKREEVLILISYFLVPFEFSCVLRCFSSVQLLCNPTDCSPPDASVQGLSGQEHWSGLPCPPPGDVPDPGMDPCLLSLLHWWAGYSPPAGKPLFIAFVNINLGNVIIGNFVSFLLSFVIPLLSKIIISHTHAHTPTPKRPDIWDCQWNAMQL